MTMENLTHDAVNVPMGEESEVILPVQETPKKRSRKKTDKPSDKTIIKNLKAEIKELEEQLDTAISEVDTQRNKAEMYFSKFMAASKELSENKDLQDRARSNMFKTIEGALIAYSMITQK